MVEQPIGNSEVLLIGAVFRIVGTDQNVSVLFGRINKGLYPYFDSGSRFKNENNGTLGIDFKRFGQIERKGFWGVLPNRNGINYNAILKRFLSRTERGPKAYCEKKIEF